MWRTRCRLRGWTLCASWDLADLVQDRPPRLAPWLTHLGQSLRTEVQYFQTYRVIGANSWARFIPPATMRAFVQVEGIVTNVGKRTPEEHDIAREFVDEEDVLTMAKSLEHRPSITAQFGHANRRNDARRRRSWKALKFIA